MNTETINDGPQSVEVVRSGDWSDIVNHVASTVPTERDKIIDLVVQSRMGEQLFYQLRNGTRKSPHPAKLLDMMRYLMPGCRLAIVRDRVAATSVATPAGNSVAQ